MLVIVLTGMTSPEDLFDFDVGLVDGRQRLNCCINLHEKSFRYYKSKRVFFTFDPALRLKRWAFRCLSEHSRPSHITNDASFLPGELLRGNADIMPFFLQQLRGQKVESFIPLRWNHKKEQKKGKKMIQRLAQLIERVRKEAFMKIANFSCQCIQRESQIEEKRKRVIDTTVIGGTNRSGVSTPPGRSPRSLSISYTRVLLPSPKQMKLTESSRVPRFRRDEAVSIRRLEEGSPHKTYTFSAGQRTWQRSASRKNSSLHF